MTRRAGRVGIAATVLLVGCATSVEPMYQPTAEPTASPAATHSDARLVVHGSGEIECPSPYGCEASIAFLPADEAQATVPPTWLAEDQPRFDVERTSGPGGRIVGIRSAPATIRPGSYLVVGDVSMISDVASCDPGDFSFPILGTVSECVQLLVVGSTIAQVRISIAFARGWPCAIGVTAEPGPDPGSARTPPISCYLLDTQICHQVVELVGRSHAHEVGAAYAVIVSDTCPVGSVCDRMYAIDVAMAIVPPVQGADPLWLHVFGKRVPDQVEAWHGPLPELIRTLLPLP
jgi:hypothetical protein